MDESFLNGRVVLHAGDCREVLAQLEECSVDSCVTDPPYHLVSIVKRFANEKPWDVEANFVARKTDGQGVGPFVRAARGFMGKQWDGGAITFEPETWRAVYRVLKPGGYLLAMGGTRTYHRMACAIEDAGFEIRDTISWLYGSGFPKSHDVSKGIDRTAGVAREVVGQRVYSDGTKGSWRTTSSDIYAQDPWTKDNNDRAKLETAPATDAARQWEGWGTALKPACELIVLARKPLSEGTIAANVLRWGTGAINVDGCRVEYLPGGRPSDSCWSRNAKSGDKSGSQIYGEYQTTNRSIAEKEHPAGRWPANVVHDGSDEVTAAFPESDHARGNTTPTKRGDSDLGWMNGGTSPVDGGDTGSAARFFYTAKADADDRLGSKHPTVKPLDLMQWLVRLVTPRGGTVLDPFAGTGTTGEAAWREGMRAVLIEAEPEYQADIRRRMALVLAGPDERTRESIKAKNLPVDYGPLFGFPEAAE